MIQVQAPASAVIWCPLLVTGRGLNDRLHWKAKAKVVKRERGMVAAAVERYGNLGGHLPQIPPYVVHLVRVYSGRQRLYDDDNWVGAAKNLRDQIAAELGVDDGNRAVIRFTYDQEKGPKAGVRIEINTRGVNAA